MLTTAVAPLLSLLLGGGAGYLAGRAPVSPLAQSLGAALLGWAAGALIGVVVWLQRSSQKSGVAAVSVGLVEGVASIALVLVAAGVLHGVVGWVGAASLRPMLLGAFAGLFGAFATRPNVALAGNS